MKIEEAIAKEALEQYGEIKAVIEANKDKTIEEVYNICNKQFFGNVFNFDGEMFAIELDTISATVEQIDSVPTLSDYFDVNKNDCEQLYNCTVEEIKAIIGGYKA